MNQTPDQIESDIDSTRAELHSNLQELENKVKSVTDWRQLFANNPAAMTATAFGVGALLAVMIGRRDRAPSAEQYWAETPRTQRSADFEPRLRSQASQSWTNIKSAAVGLAASKVTDFLGSVMPGFAGELRKASTNNENRPSTNGPDPHRPLM